MRQPIHFEVEKSFKYSNGSGAEVECNFIALLPPTGKVTHTCCAIEGLIQSCVFKMKDIIGEDKVQEAAELARVKKDVEEVEPEIEKSEEDIQATLALMAGSGVDMSKLVLYFRELFKEVAMMGAEKKMTASRLDAMDHADLRRMIGTYTANFILN